MKDKIEVWEAFDEPLEIKEDSSQNELRVLLDEEPEQIPDEIIDETFEDRWSRLEEEGKENGEIPYLETRVEQNENAYIFYMTSKRGFKLTAVMNRQEDLHDTYTQEVFRNKLLSNSTHCHLRTNDGELVFGRKKDQRDQITGFSGFTRIDKDNIAVDSDLEDNKKELDIFRLIKKRLEPELGEDIVDNISSMNAVGITFVNTPGLRGTDTDYVVDVDLSTQEVEDRFDPDEQFYDELLTVEFKPESMAKFITEHHGDGTEVSKYAAGCMYAEACAYKDEESAKVIAEAIRTEYDTEFSTENTTDYFKDQQDQ